MTFQLQGGRMSLQCMFSDDVFHFRTQRIKENTKSQISRVVLKLEFVT